MKVKLSCLWSDYYDAWFDKAGYAWERHLEPNMERPEMMSRLLAWGFSVPTHGIAASVIPKAMEAYQTDDLYFIVHVDPKAGGGEGKVLLDAKTCLIQFPNVFVTHFLGNTNAREFYMYKFLKVGGKAFGFKVTGSFWKADYSKDSIIELCCTSATNTYNEKIPYVVYSLDYVELNGTVYAVDFNNAPHLESLGLRDELAGQEVVVEIKDAIEYYKQKEINY